MSSFTAFVEERGRRTGLTVEAAFMLACQQHHVTLRAGQRAEGLRNLLLDRATLNNLVFLIARTIKGDVLLLLLIVSFLCRSTQSGQDPP